MATKRPPVAQGRNPARLDRGTSVSRGLSLHIGLNRIDPEHYASWSGVFYGCESDANDMEAVTPLRRREQRGLAGPGMR